MPLKTSQALLEKRDSGLIYRDFEVGNGDWAPKAGQQGRPAKIRFGTNGLVSGRTSTFFSAKRFEVFDVELLDVQDCQRRTIGFYSDVVCN
ncbi:hypothetical protein RJ639_011585 [Escallonia herrerae]|uniref:Uncharacterized protein n=1 Tax=Escallonia herrerae TaxID=1293975 RepID=A0AA88VME9_9ASTE|nr:hypothetical protein RJ639_011585 [Escallonia herrerae]